MERGAVATVSQVNIYPMKSCRGISVPTANLSSTGFEWDRQWMVVNSRGRFITQRQEPRLALIEVALPIEALDRKWGPLRHDSALRLSTPGMEPLQVPLKPSGRRVKVPVTIWEWSGFAFDEGSSGGAWFSKYLGQPGLRLVRFDPGSSGGDWFSKYLGQSGLRLVRFDPVNETRLTDPRYAVGYKTAFSDGYPLLLVSEGSLDALNERLPEPLPVNRFRPNIVVKGCKPNAEDFWRKFRIGGEGGGKFQGVKIRGRCKITTTNQQTAEVGTEPLSILRSFRLGQLLSPLPQMKGQVFFGQNVIFDTADGFEFSVNVGDEVHVLEKAASITEVMMFKSVA